MFPGSLVSGTFRLAVLGAGAVAGMLQAVCPLAALFPLPTFL